MAALLFVAFWIVLGIGIVFVALRGGPRGAREALQTQTPRARRVVWGTFIFIFLAFGVALPLALITGNEHNESKQVRGVRLAAIDRHGRNVFFHQCGLCHTLAAARTQGKVGPNLDTLKPPKALVLNALAFGRQRGNGTMPARLVTGSDAQAVADFVSRVAGK